MDSEYYEVEKILKCKAKKGKRVYLIKWKNFPSTSNSWEPEENLTEDLVADYHRRIDSKKTSDLNKSSSITSPQVHHRRRIVSLSGNSSNDEASNEDSASNFSSNYITQPATQEELDKFLSIHSGKTPLDVNGAVRIQGKLFHKVSWKDGSQDDLIPAKFSNILWPSLVINFYQKHMILSA